jgi:uncharacterized protein (DUF2141 family)
MKTRNRSLNRWASALLLLAATPAFASQIVVRISGLERGSAQLGCMLYDRPDGFPMTIERARVQWVTVDGPVASCRFDAVQPGRYAVSVLHDRNANRRIDTGFKGIPTEPWGVSRNVRPLLREPRFDEAAIEVTAAEAETVIDIRVR